MLWSNMYSAASPRFTIHSASAGGRTPNAIFCAYVAHVAWLSPQIPQMRLVMKCASRGSLPFMKMLYPRKMDEVLWHSATCLFSKSILVKMPRLPTIRVIGSQFISTRFPFLLGTSLAGAVIVLIRSLLFLLVGLSVMPAQYDPAQYDRGWYPVVSSARG